MSDLHTTRGGIWGLFSCALYYDVLSENQFRNYRYSSKKARVKVAVRPSSRRLLHHTRAHGNKSSQDARRLKPLPRLYHSQQRKPRFWSPLEQDQRIPAPTRGIIEPRSISRMIGGDISQYYAEFAYSTWRAWSSVFLCVVLHSINL
jgi:hypothetical protein